MITCFLFIDKLDDDVILSLCLDSQGMQDAPLQMRKIREIQSLQRQAKTVVVLPATRCSMLAVQLPWLSERKARAAIPYALEEQLAQNVSMLHFSFDRSYYKDNQYLVAVIDKAYLSGVIAKLSSSGIAFDTITSDWFALDDNQCCMSEKYLLVNDNSFKGALSLDLAAKYLNSNPGTELIVFNDSAPIPDDMPCIKKDTTALFWVASKLQQKAVINFCQGEFQQDTKRRSLRFWYTAAGALAGGALLVFILLNSIKVIGLNNKIDTLDSQIEVIYREFFPDATQVISPRFRIEQALKSNAGGQDSSFWTLLSKLTQADSTKEITIEQLLFQNKTLAVTLLSMDFSTLERLQRQLKQTNIHVNQTRASSQDDQVIATLELTL